ncbi:hypothetical protein Sgleb_72450 [Streptomyces glebosus]|uniref:Uncharacterized protein n=1 Tax=Streptomyces glebosus TaxID=249580 RepID=A0A640T7B6_9ACTN|nr:hypothetical protein Sgleb_72450 [Streptomyces glebosus]GHG77060.1 hypothetical protein GCM10010513_52460 [Streptomyces glebosus]
MEEFTQRHRGRLEAMPLRRARGPGLLAGGERVLLRILEFAEEARPGQARQALEQLAALHAEADTAIPREALHRLTLGSGAGGGPARREPGRARPGAGRPAGRCGGLGSGLRLGRWVSTNSLTHSIRVLLRRLPITPVALRERWAA